MKTVPGLTHVSDEAVTKKVDNMTRYEKFLEEATAEYIEHDRLMRVRKQVLSNMEKRRRVEPELVYGDGGFGVLAEKTLHATLKYFNEPDDDYHEVALNGFFADICRDGHITEIQTKRLANLKKKLECLLENYDVTVVYPVAVNKWRGYCENAFERPTGFRLSGTHRDEYTAFDEIYGIKGYLSHPGLHIHLYLMDMEETLVKQGKVKGRRRSRSGYERFDTVPLGIRRIVRLDSVNDYMQFIPDFDATFTSADFAEASGCRRGTASLVLAMLTHIGIVKRIGKQGRYYLYEVGY